MTSFPSWTPEANSPNANNRPFPPPPPVQVVYVRGGGGNWRGGRGRSRGRGRGYGYNQAPPQQQSPCRTIPGFHNFNGKWYPNDSGYTPKQLGESLSNMHKASTSEHN
ncbi:hypothetical protein [Nanhai ghost shark arterivirus]|uniref:Uncharacterized protein n=1 Tax=Nanhai ghost shark arterivirus TaxID=2116441 RepID=A0A2P1GND3_9NIDO|nr:hypothetical protein [Nanhai ghost shark arterivirus]AVM87329.1 hypothetical protein [Nanhai ghost shark arterivirus]